MDCCSNAGMVGDTTVDIWVSEGIGPICKYEDDLNVFRYPIPKADGSLTFTYDRQAALDLIAPLRVPWHPDKGQDFSTLVIFLGFLWDIATKSVSLAKPKRIKFLDRVISFITSFSNTRCQIHDIMRIHGSLCHITYVYPLGRSRLASLSTFISTFNDDSFT
jgi:hypothetical protein